jgi:hypothetical protein
MEVQTEFEFMKEFNTGKPGAVSPVQKDVERLEYCDDSARSLPTCRYGATCSTVAMVHTPT